MDSKYKMLSILIILLSLVVVKIGEAYFDYKLRVELNRQHKEVILLLCEIVEKTRDTIAVLSESHHEIMLKMQEDVYHYRKVD